MMGTAYYAAMGGLQIFRTEPIELNETGPATNMPTDELKTAWDVLVVDDDGGIRELMMAYFDGLGMSVTGAPDGRSAIAALQRSHGRFGLVVTDLSLPGADGFAVLQAAKQANASSYVVIVTGYASLDSAIQAVRVGAYDYLAKPFSLGQLDVILRRITDRATLERENRQLVHHVAPLTPPPATGYTVLEQRIAAMEGALARIEARLR
jgi:two-component system response regulator AtoC